MKLSKSLDTPRNIRIAKDMKDAVLPGRYGFTTAPRKRDTARIHEHITFIKVTEENGIFMFCVPKAKLATKASRLKAHTNNIASKVTINKLNTTMYFTTSAYYDRHRSCVSSFNGVPKNRVVRHILRFPYLTPLLTIYYEKFLSLILTMDVIYNILYI